MLDYIIFHLPSPLFPTHTHTHTHTGSHLLTTTYMYMYLEDNESLVTMESLNLIKVEQVQTNVLYVF